MRFLWSFRINQNFWCARRFRLRKCGESAPENMKIQIIFWCRQFRILCRRRRLEGRRPEKWRSYLETAKLFHASRRVTKMAKPFWNSEAVSRSPVLRSKAFGAPSSAELLLVAVIDSEFWRKLKKKHGQKRYVIPKRTLAHCCFSRSRFQIGGGEISSRKIFWN